MTPKLTDDRIIGIIDFQIGQSVGFSQSRLSKERERVLRYRNGERPLPMHRGQSDYMSLDVYDSVESMKAQLLEVFTGNTRPAKFSQMPDEDEDSANTRTDYVNNVILDQNPGFSIFQTVIGDGLIGRNGIVKVWWDTKVEPVYFDLSDAGLSDIAAYVQKNPTAQLEEYELNEGEADESAQRIKRARFRINKDRSQVRIECLPPEEFGISPMAKSIKEAELVFHRRPMTVSELIKQGYDPKIVKTLQDDERVWMTTEPELLARFEQTDDLIGQYALEDGQQARKVCIVYECYLELDLTDDGSNDDSKGVSQLYKVVKVGNTILHKEPVSMKPFVDFCPLPREHAFWGINFAELLVPTQVARTYLARSIIDHTLTTNNPRMMVAQGGVKSPRELQENRFGGIVNVRTVQDIAPLPQAPMNPFVFQTIQALQADKEQLTGISQLSQGLNKDAISKQNSQEMVQELISVSQIRQKIVARNFAEGFLRQLYDLVYRLVIENESEQKVVQVTGGKWANVDFTTWPEDCPIEVQFALGYGEAEKEGKKWAAMDAYMSKPDLAPLYPLAKRFNVLKRLAEASGIKDLTPYMLTPDQVPPPQPSPMEQADLAVKQADAQVKLANAKAAQLKAQLDLLKLQRETQMELQKMQLENKKVDAKIQLDHDKLAHQVSVDAFELQLELAAAQNDKVTAVAEPTHG